MKIYSEAFKEALDAGLTETQAASYDKYVAKRSYKNRTGRVAYKDSSQSRVYNAEHKFEAKFPGKSLADQKDAQKFVNRIVASKTWKSLTETKSAPIIEMKKNMGYSSRTAGVAYGYGVIKLCPKFGLNTYVVIHEMAHMAGHMHHDVEFRKTLVKLVSRFMGRDAAKYLKECFKEEGLKMSVRKTAIMSPAQWLEKYLKMENMRAYLSV